MTAIVIAASGGLLTMLFNFLRLPTSTIQILVYCVIGAAVAAGLNTDWTTLGTLAGVWVAAPLAACALGYLLTRALDRLVPREAATEQARRQLEQHDMPGSGIGALVPGAKRELADELRVEAAGERPSHPALPVWLLRTLPLLLIAVGVFASFVMGGNDIANATSGLILVQAPSPDRRHGRHRSRPRTRDGPTSPTRRHPARLVDRPRRRLQSATVVDPWVPVRWLAVPALLSKRRFRLSGATPGAAA